jgi:hypothetical protein
MHGTKEKCIQIFFWEISKGNSVERRMCRGENCGVRVRTGSI